MAGRNIPPLTTEERQQKLYRATSYHHAESLGLCYGKNEKEALRNARKMWGILVCFVERVKRSKR